MAWKRRLSMRRLGAVMSRGLKSAGRGASTAVQFTGETIGATAKYVRNSFGHVLDDVVFALVPEMGARRKVMRAIVEASEVRTAQRLSTGDVDRDGSDNKDRLHGAQRWLGHRLSPDSELERSLEEMQQRSLEICRTTTAGGAVDQRVDHVIGKGFTVQAKIAASMGISKEAATGWNEQLEAMHGRWSQKCDLSGKDSLWQCSRLVERCLATYGEAFTILWLKDRPGQPIPLVLEIVDPERISTPPAKSGDPFCRMGIQYSTDNEIIGYWLRSTHPFDTRQVQYRWDFIPADRMLHVYEKWFPGQSRGYPWMSRSLDRLRDGEDLDEAGIIAAQVEACNAAFVKTRQPLKAAKAAATGTTTTGNRLEDTVPGKIHYLDADAEEVLFNNPTKSNIVGTLHEWNHRRIAAGMNWPYEFLMKDWRGVSFAGGRLVLNGAKISCQCEQQLLTIAWFACIWNEEVRLAVLFSDRSGVEINASRFLQRPWIYQAHQWSAPAWSYAITPMEEVQADVMAVENNFKTLESVVGERAGNMEDVLKQRKIERDMERDLDIEPPDRVAAIAQQGSQAAKPDVKKPAPQKPPQDKEAASV